MKVRNYEKNVCIMIICIIIFFLELIFINYLYHSKMYEYKKISGIVMKKNIILIVASKEERKIIYKNSYFYINNKKNKYKVIEDRGVVITKGRKKYYEMLIRFDFDKVYKSNDTINICIKNKKYRTIEIFKLIWGGE